jgi:hypothetical protein
VSYDQVHVTTLDRNVALPHTDAGLQGLAVGDPLVYVGHQGDVWLRTVADVKRVWLTDNRGARFRIEDGAGAGDFEGHAYTQADWEYLFEGMTLRSLLVEWGWVPRPGGPRAMDRTQLRMAARLVERFGRMNDPELPGSLRKSAFGRTGAKVADGEGLLAAQQRGSVAKVAEDLAELLREGGFDPEEALSMLNVVRSYLRGLL